MSRDCLPGQRLCRLRAGGNGGFGVDAAFVSFGRAAAWLVTAGAACMAVACGVLGVPGHFG